MMAITLISCMHTNSDYESEQAEFEREQVELAEEQAELEAEVHYVYIHLLTSGEVPCKRESGILYGGGVLI